MAAGSGKEEYFYYETTRKMVAVFGAFFNNIFTARRLADGTLANMQRVPLSYGPRSKFLTRIREEKPDQVQIKLPRMAFDLTGFEYDAARALNNMNRRKFCVDGNDNLRDSSFGAAPYNLSFELNIFSRTQDEILQILEQILPVFTPEYTVQIKGMDGPGTSTDVPFILDSVGLSDEYEGDWVPARPIVYTLSFTAKAKYRGAVTRQAIIERAMVNHRNFETGAFAGEKVVAVGYDNAASISFISSINPDHDWEVRFGFVPAYQVGENIIGVDSGYAGVVKEVTANSIIIHRLENMFDFDETYGVGEELFGEKSNVSEPFVSVVIYEEPK